MIIMGIPEYILKIGRLKLTVNRIYFDDVDNYVIMILIIIIKMTMPTPFDT